LPSGEAWFACKGLIGALLRDAVNLPAVPSSLPDTRERTIGLYSTDHGSGRGHHALGRVLRRDPEANMIILSRTKEDKARSSELSVRDIDRAVKEMCPAHSPARSFSSCLRQGPPNARHEPLTEAGAERTL
jgi:hypothetical protein